MNIDECNPSPGVDREHSMYWYSTELPGEPFAVKNKGMKMVTADSEDGFQMFVQTHMKAYGCRADDETYKMYRLDIQEGVVDRDKMITVLQADHPVGCMSYEVLEKPDGFKYIFLHNLGVDLDHRGWGFGEEIIKIVLNMLIDDFGGGMAVLAEVPPRDATSRNILEKMGFGRVEPEAWFPSPTKGKKGSSTGEGRALGNAR
ncbi:MAG: GNAT family N-acetyltransferase [Planctomycetota bacterium]|jgi:ribosomal protein S18 acetylase RimI-like enzyme